MSNAVATGPVSVIPRSVAAGARLVAVVCAVAAGAAILAESGPAVSTIAAVLCLLGMAVLMLIPRWRPVALVSTGYTMLGGVAIAAAVVAAPTGRGPVEGYVVTLIAVGTILVGAAQHGVRSAAMRVTVALLATEAMRFAALGSVGEPYRPDLLLLASFALAGAATFAAARNRSRTGSMRLTLQSATREDEVSSVRRSMELQATAFMHDTVLGHLAAISAAEPGVLTEHARTQISRDIALLIGRHWLLDETDAHDPAVGSWEESPVRAAIADVHSDAFEVTVTGDVGAIDRVTIEQENALALAIKQSLVNARAHARVDAAEVVLLATRDAVSVMVVDDGIGFDPEATPGDRLGISRSIKGRIAAVGGSVSIWSSPGSGTSVVMSVPVEDAVDPAPVPEPLG